MSRVLRRDEGRGEASGGWRVQWWRGRGRSVVVLHRAHGTSVVARVGAGHAGVDSASVVASRRAISSHAADHVTVTSRTRVVTQPACIRTPHTRGRAEPALHHSTLPTTTTASNATSATLRRATATPPPDTPSPALHTSRSPPAVHGRLSTPSHLTLLTCITISSGADALPPLSSHSFAPVSCHAVCRVACWWRLVFLVVLLVEATRVGQRCR